MPPEIRLELQRLLSALCDGELTDAQHARLQELLDADAECRRLYLEYVDVHARLLVHPGLGVPKQEDKATAKPGDGETEIPAASVSFETVRNRPPRRVPQAARYVLVAAGTLAASFLVQALWWRPAGPGGRHEGAPVPGAVEVQIAGYVATLTQTADCVWESQKEPRLVGSRLLPGELRLRKGVARIRFDSGPELVVEGPAALRLDSGTAATVLGGKIVFRADETAAPFDLHTPSSTLVHVGTEYAVAVDADGEEVQVFDGDVQRRPRTAPGGARPELLKAGEARRYGPSPASAGQPAAFDPARFVRELANPAQPPDPKAGLLAYEGFDYRDPALFLAGKADGGLGWAGPWTPLFARPLNPGDQDRQVLNVKKSLRRPGAAVPSVGGCFDYAGFTKYYRRLAEPVRLDTDGVYYLSFLFRRAGPSDDEVNAVAVLLWTSEEYRLAPKGRDDPRKRLNIGVRGWNQLFTQLHDVSCRTPLPLVYGETYLLVAKIVASGANPDQVFMRVYGPQEPIEREETGSWSVVGPSFRSDLAFDWLQLHINSKQRQTIDELRLGTTWVSVTAPWIAAPGAGKKGGQ
jgi:ferric-dicitrate binding protein FerR (iron transport regulator)